MGKELSPQKHYGMFQDCELKSEKTHNTKEFCYMIY